MTRHRHWVAFALAITTLLACQRGSVVSSVRVVSGEVDAGRLLAPLAARATRAGAGALETIGAAVVAQGDQLGSFIELTEPGCLLVVAQPSESIADVDVLVFTDSGRRIAADESSRPQAALMVCPDALRRLYIAARVVQGSGMLALGVMPVPRSASPRVAHAVQARGGPEQDTGRLDAWPGLEAKLRERRKWLGGAVARPAPGRHAGAS